VADNQSDNKEQKNTSVLITGGSGLIGKYITMLLISKGFKVSHLSRKPVRNDDVRIFHWDPEKKIIDTEAFNGVDYLIHLTGANIGEDHWTKKRKKEIINSRIESAKLLHKVVTENKIKLKAFLSASAVGYYGSVTSDKIFIEADPPAEDFLGSTCKEWEEAADLFEKAGIRTVKIRTAVVLEKNDSALSKLMLPSKFGFLLQTGNGRQYMPWIHINDLCGIYLKAITDSAMSGAFNAVSPQHVSHREFMQTLGKVLKCPVFFLPVPGFIIRLVLGQMSDVVLKGSRVSSEKTEKTGYKFLFNNLADALTNATQT
jgi:uncharacterized protein (TIGR01777 family)